MILNLLRRERAVRTLALYFPLSIAFGFFLWAACIGTEAELGDVPYQNHIPGVYQVLIVVWGVLFNHLMINEPARRCTEFDLTLGITPKTMWLTRYLSIIGTGWLILLTMSAAVIFANWYQGVQPLIAPGLISFAVYLGAGHFLALAVLQTPQPGLSEIPARPWYIVLVVLTLAAYLALTVVLSTVPRVYTWIPLAIGLFLSIRTYFKLPMAFAVVPLENQPSRRTFSRASSIRKEPENSYLRRRWLKYWAIFRSTSPLAWVFFPAAFVFHGVVLSSTGMSTYFSFFFLAWVILASWTMFSLRGIFRFDHWPLPRKHIFAVLALPPLITVSLGYIGGSIAFSYWDPTFAGVDFKYSPSGCCYSTRVPHEFWRIAWKGDIPEQTSPWGESHPLQGKWLIKGSNIRVYNPFQTPPTASPEFAALQISRAIKAVHGRDISYQTIHERYLETGPDGKVRLKSMGLTLSEDFPDLTGSTHGYRSLISLLVVSLPWLIFSALTFKTLQAHWSDLTRKFVIVSMFVPMVLLGVGSIAAHATGLVSLPALGYWSSVLIWTAGESTPVGLWSAWFVGILLVLMAYLIARKAFQGIEVDVG